MQVVQVVRMLPGAIASSAANLSRMDRYVITVDFWLHPGALEPFLALIRDNASRSLASEPGCERFDVLIEKGKPDHVLLYEIYRDRNAFDQHLKSAHYADFSKSAQPYVRSKAVLEFEPISPGGS